MTSSTSDSAFVWTWLYGQSDPVVAGRLQAVGETLRFGYAQSYLARPHSISLGPELPLIEGFQDIEGRLRMPSCLRDGAPDSWGRRVILNQLARSEQELLAGSAHAGRAILNEGATAGL